MCLWSIERYFKPKVWNVVLGNDNHDISHKNSLQQKSSMEIFLTIW